ncbi:hypothetical protein SIO70_16330 [Chitinophaga sancti]|uniref:hypothetical protein n=1 Tax=Chitinophaga sancti TaxID=1004 RepID=UPI002A759EA0|nr:hypothetical protein [Chitinophaga sancti]WPQ66428.1 hypothetical protein SIO70_16330 [Chitinophaga sancti]
MFSFFKKSKVSIQSARIPDFGWKKIREDFLSQVRHYVNLIENEVQWGTEIDKLEHFER